MTVQTFVPGSNITFTQDAVKHLLTQVSEAGAKGIRVAVKPSGCSGYKYVLDAVDKSDSNDVVLHLEGGLDVFVDKESLPMIQGMEVDYVKEGLNRSIQFRNPNVTGECGCGESFSVK
ncbi:MAG TPA: iron-sulfur cluster assembly accessory protein [Pseudomonadales bacterium]|nr:iron-sulfur cluster assembly accessory protein [Pseudomonadales bacterium]